MPSPHAYIRSVGRYLPERRLTNKDLEKMVDTSDEWIMTRTGIRERRILEPGLGNSFMAVRASRECLERAGVQADEIDAVIVGTVTPDMLFPSTACLVQKAIGAGRAWGFDLSAGCSGFIYALSAGAQMIESGRYAKVLVIGSDVMSSIINYRDRNTCVLFGDGAGAVLLESCPEQGYGILDFIHHMDGGGGDHLYMKAGAVCVRPASRRCRTTSTTSCRKAGRSSRQPLRRWPAYPWKSSRSTVSRVPIWPSSSRTRPTCASLTPAPAVWA